MKKKGFTLVELLAVIVILAVIALITVPVVSNIIKDSKKNVFKLSIQSISDDIKNYYTKNYLLSDLDDNIVFNFDTKENLNLISSGSNLPSHGSIIITDDGGIIVNVNDGVYCAVKATNQDSIIVGDMIDGSCNVSLPEVCSLNVGYTWDFDYISTGEDRSQEFVAPCTGNYKLEVWGAQGGKSIANNTVYDMGGKGGYSAGNIKLNNGDKLYIVTGGKGGSGSLTACSSGGYNGGGFGTNDGGGCGNSNDDEAAGGGGGATHIALNNNLGELKNYINNKEDILIVAGGGGGGSWITIYGGSGGGLEGGQGGASSSANQTTGYAFGQGQNGSGAGDSDGIGGGGGGWYGGYKGRGNGESIDMGGGGSGFIGNGLLKDKYMYCYNCPTSPSTNVDTYTISNGTNSCTSANPVAHCAKEGNGYARITFVSKTTDASIKSEVGDTWVYNYKEENGNGVEQIFTAPVTGVYKLEVWGAQGGVSGSYIGGYGGYSTGVITLNKNSDLYINVGEQGDHCSGTTCSIEGGYNGGGGAKYYSPCDRVQMVSSGGGATHIALASGLLTAFDPTLENSIYDKLLIVAGGGGGSNWCNDSNRAYGGHGGGFIGVGSINLGASDWARNGGENAVGATQDSGFAFGQGAGTSTFESIGAGGGYYGGKNSSINGAGGGSGYIGNDLLSNKHMYCYNCTQSAASNINTYTISNGTNSCKNSFAISDCAKEGHGYARITLIEIK